MSSNAYKQRQLSEVASEAVPQQDNHKATGSLQQQKEKFSALENHKQTNKKNPENIVRSHSKAIVFTFRSNHIDPA